MKKVFIIGLAIIALNGALFGTDVHKANKHTKPTETASSTDVNETHDKQLEDNKPDSTINGDVYPGYSTFDSKYKDAFNRACKVETRIIVLNNCVETNSLDDLYPNYEDQTRAMLKECSALQAVDLRDKETAISVINNYKRNLILANLKYVDEKRGGVILLDTTMSEDRWKELFPELKRFNAEDITKLANQRDDLPAVNCSFE